MKDNTQEKNLIERNENSIFGKIKNFFKNLFGKKEVEVNNLVDEATEMEMEKSEAFRSSIRNMDLNNKDANPYFFIKRGYYEFNVSSVSTRMGRSNFWLYVCW